jgi:hydrogenase nickel incorporation protein HypA/HybF
MHEIGLMQQALAIALEQAAGQGARQVHRVTFRIGAESGVVPEVIALAFDVTTRGTIARGAQLEIEHVPLTCFCAACAREFQPADGDLLHTCPHCHRSATEVRRGREFQLVSLDVD